MELRAKPSAPFPGAPLEPTGDPLIDAVGPAAYTHERARRPDLTVHGEPKIVPMRTAHGFSIEPRDPDPRGMAVHGSDGGHAGTVTDVWVDRSEPQIRYLEVDVGEELPVLVPIGYAKIDGRGRTIRVKAVRTDQIRNAPRTFDAQMITLHEEDRITAYYAGGYLYAEPGRLGPWL